MAMSAGGNNGGPMSEINVTPMVDVMLVLLIIFMITAPLLTHKIKVTLPDANPHVTKKEKKLKPIDLAVKEDGRMYWNDNYVSESELKAKLAIAANNQPQPELHVRAAKTAKYKSIKTVLTDAKNAGMVHVGFITTGHSGNGSQ